MKNRRGRGMNLAAAAIIIIIGRKTGRENKWVRAGTRGRL